MTAKPDESSSDPTGLEREAYGWVVRFLSGEAGRDDIEALREWSARSPDHAAAFEEASRVAKLIDRAALGLPAGVAAARPATGKEVTVPRRAPMARRAFLGGAVAASAAAGALMVVHPPLGLWPSWVELAADYRTAAGEQRRIVLADSVSIEMNTKTSIALRSSQTGAGDIELVAGEAMVSAPETSSPITVVAGDGRIVAADARFNVRYDDRYACVTCVQGEVRVERHGAGSTLVAGQQITYSNRETSPPIAVDSTTVTAWRDGIVIFDGTPIAVVVNEINRYRSGRIILTNAALGRERFNARFRIENIDRVVGQIEQIFGARATNLPGGITLLG